jgi:hypothetical protein
MVEEAGRQARDSFPSARPWVVWLARLGYAAKGIVYIIVGMLAFAAARGSGGRTTGTRGALVEIITQPFGEILLAIVALGLVGYVLWRFVQAIVDPEHKGTDTKSPCPPRLMPPKRSWRFSPPRSMKALAPLFYSIGAGSLTPPSPASGRGGAPTARFHGKRVRRT